MRTALVALAASALIACDMVVPTDASTDASLVDTQSDAPGEAAEATDAGPGGVGVVISTDGGLLAPRVLAIQTINWNSANLQFGTIHAVAESAGQTVVFSSTGASLVVSGGAMAIATSVRSWRTAATIPSTAMLPPPDAGIDAGPGTYDWVVGVDGDGHLHRMYAMSVMEPISDRYGFGADAVTALAPMGGRYAAFASDRIVAVADSTQVIRYDLAVSSFAAGGGLIVGAVGDNVRIGRPSNMNWGWYAVPGLSLVALDRTGRIYAATRHALYVEDDAHRLVVRYRNDTAEIRAIAASGPRVWFSVGTELGTIESGVLSITTALALPAQTGLIGSPSGDVWALTAGRLTRYRTTPVVLSDRDLWEANVAPVYARLCVRCHANSMPVSGISLSTYESWESRRADIYRRVILRPMMGAMPPVAADLNPADREAIRVWSMPATPDSGVDSGAPDVLRIDAARTDVPRTDVRAGG